MVGAVIPGFGARTPRECLWGLTPNMHWIAC